ncbi:MAG TPA: nicotinate-nucleotide adenylyltransferase [Pyrinomonadaceae bacterium]|nr:nicotinate-nucleotide adenylyltransferase [Pyrinomonadaceae bacterium]
MDRRKRIALYGGTFDPIHLGHLEVARRVTELFEIDELLFVLAKLAPHKMQRDVTAGLHRYAMLALATQDAPHQSISTFELDAPGRCYTADTVAHFKTLLGESADLFFVMGADSWTEITSWHEWERLLTTANQVVVTRPGYSSDGWPMTPLLAERIVDLRGENMRQIADRTRSSRQERVYITDAVMIDVSATDIRRAARENAPELSRMVPPPVADYIRKYELYEDSNET